MDTCLDAKYTIIGGACTTVILLLSFFLSVTLLAFIVLNVRASLKCTSPEP